MKSLYLYWNINCRSGRGSVLSDVKASNVSYPEEYVGVPFDRIIFIIRSMPEFAELLGKAASAETVMALRAALGPWEIKSYRAVGKVCAPKSLCMFPVEFATRLILSARLEHDRTCGFGGQRMPSGRQMHMHTRVFSRTHCST